MTTAVESVDDRVLAILEKGHTREDFFQVVRLFDEVGLSLAPTFVAFTPWITLDGYLDLLKVIAELGLIRSVAPVQLTIRLLIPPGSRLLELPEVRALVGALDEAALVYPWSIIGHLDRHMRVEVPKRTQQFGNVATGEGLRYSNSEHLRPSDRFECSFHRLAYL